MHVTRLKAVAMAAALSLIALVTSQVGPAAAKTRVARAQAPIKADPKLQGGLEGLAGPRPGALGSDQRRALPVTGDRVLVEAVAATDAQVLLRDLAALGLVDGAAFGRMVSGSLPIEALSAAARLDSLQFARPVLAGANVGSTTSQGDPAMGTDVLRAIAAVDGTGVTVGSVSTSYNCLGGAAADIASDDLPAAADLNILDDTVCPMTNIDEGRGMMQLIHDVAPGAAQAFHTGINGQPAMAQGILDLAAAGSDVINDDIFYLANPFFQDGVIAQAADTVVGVGIPYFSSAGNQARRSYEQAFRPDAGANGCSAGASHDFDPGPGVDLLQQVTIPSGARMRLSFQWDQPFFSVSGAPGSASDIDICLLDNANAVVGQGIVNNVGNDPFEFIDFTNPGPGATFNLAITRAAGPNPGRMKYIDFGSALTGIEYATNSSTVIGHANSAGAEALGAAFYDNTPVFGQNPPLLEGFSSAGGTPILFDTAGNPIAPVVRQKPGIVAPDGTNNTFFGNDIADPGDGSDTDAFPNFFGTSAAAPHAAAFAALLLDTNPALTPAQVYTTLRTTAIDMAAPGFDFDSGFGLIQAQGIVMVPCVAPPPPGPGDIVVAAPGLVTLGTAGDDVIYGTDGFDRIAGLGGNDTIFGQGGADQLTGGEGDDVVCGGAGNDRLFGGAGSDTLSGDLGDDDLAADTGDDTLFGGLGIDRLTGGADDDLCVGGGQVGDQVANCEN